MTSCGNLRARFTKLAALVLCDRGFRRVSWLCLIDKHALGFVVRLMGDVHVQLEGQSVAMQSLSLKPGHIRDLGTVPLRSDAKHSFRVIWLSCS